MCLLSNEVMMSGHTVHDKRRQEFQAADKICGVANELASVWASAGLSRSPTKFGATALIKNG